MKQLRDAIRTYTRLCKKIEKSRSDTAGPGMIQDISGAFFDRTAHEQVVDHLQRSLVLDDEDDGIRLLLAYEYWRAARIDEAAIEYRRIVLRDKLQAVVAARMILEIERT